VRTRRRSVSVAASIVRRSAEPRPLARARAARTPRERRRFISLARAAGAAHDDLREVTGRAFVELRARRRAAAPARSRCANEIHGNSFDVPAACTPDEAHRHRLGRALRACSGARSAGPLARGRLLRTSARQLGDWHTNQRGNSSARTPARPGSARLSSPSGGSRKRPVDGELDAELLERGMRLSRRRGSSITVPEASARSRQKSSPPTSTALVDQVDHRARAEGGDELALAELPLGARDCFLPRLGARHRRRLIPSRRAAKRARGARSARRRASTSARGTRVVASRLVGLRLVEAVYRSGLPSALSRSKGE
jgi:hypothetical protein